MAVRRRFRRRKGKSNVGEGDLAWLECARCGGDVWAPEDTTPTCDRCTLSQTVRAIAKEVKHETPSDA